MANPTDTDKILVAIEALIKMRNEIQRQIDELKTVLRGAK